jgi:hypothetical protein
MKLYSKLENLNKKDIKKIVNLTLMWCIKKWGLNKKRKGLLCVEFGWEKKNYMGQYEYGENIISIYPKSIKNVRDLIDTTIHEFTHQRQSMSYYHTILKKSGYSEHPMEIEANDVAFLNRKKCWDDVKCYF